MMRSVIHSLSASNRRVVWRDLSTWLGMRSATARAGLRYSAWYVAWRRVARSRTSTAEELTGWKKDLW